MAKKVAIPHMGGYTELIKGFGDRLGWDIYVCPPATRKTLQLGTKYMNELMCLPAKVTLGNFIEACEKGYTDLLMFDSCGECRLKTYWVLQQRALHRMGYDATVHPIRLGKGMPKDIRAVDRSIPYWKAWWAFLKLLPEVLEYDRKLLDEVGDIKNTVKLGVVGEIYTILEPTVNMNLLGKLAKLGAAVHNSLPLSYFIFKGLYNRNWLKRKGIQNSTLKIAKAKAHQYFPKEIGGHGNESIIHSIYYALSGFDGVIHVLPFPCMPESTVAPVLEDISKEYDIPMLRLIFDEHTAEGGLVTRLEAFVDILGRRKRAKVRGG